MKKKKGTFSTIILFLVLVTGLSLLLYPSFSNYWNSKHASHAIAAYAENVANMDVNKYESLWNDAIAYNERIQNRDNPYVVTEEEKEQYYDLLSPSGDGILGYIEIPALSVYLPIYHGTSESVLQIAVGHIEWTSLPTGGSGTHCALSGHRGLPSAKLFTDLDDLVIGDRFMMQILGETLTYEVDQILIVEPEDSTALLIEEGKDLCTLVTCTPYGINSHRLLVRGHRVANDAESVVVRVTSDAIQVEPLIIAVFIGVPILFAMLILMSLLDKLRDD